MINKVIEVISNTLGIQVDAFTDQKNCDKWDSLRHLNIIIAIEEAFDVSFEPEDIAEIKSIIDIVDYLNKFKGK